MDSISDDDTMFNSTHEEDIKEGILVKDEFIEEDSFNEEYIKENNDNEYIREGTEEEEEEETECTREIVTATPLFPAKSKETYLKCYNAFMNWRAEKGIQSLSEDVLLRYFSELAEQFNLKPSTLWSRYSMLKHTLNMHHSIDLRSYKQLSTFIKRQASGFRRKETKILTNHHINKFLREAPDDKYLAVKVALVFGVMGACRRGELTNITVNDIEQRGNILLVRIRDTGRSFTIDGEFCDIVRSYQKMRPPLVSSDRFFLSIRNGKCTVQPIGINKFGSMPRIIAEYLQLPNASEYTGHSFRRSSATLLADIGADIRTIKRHCGRTSTNNEEGHVEESMNNKQEISNRIMSSVLFPIHLCSTVDASTQTDPLPQLEDLSVLKSRSNSRADSSLKLHSTA